MPQRVFAPSAALCLVLLTTGCGSDVGAPPGAEPVRESLPNGGQLVRYAALPTTIEAPLEPDLVLGEGSTDPAYLFGDVRSVDARDDGSIYVLDHQASEVRRFNREGVYEATVVSKGEGPAEIMEANGMVFVGDSVLWIQDPREWRMIAVTPSGEELQRVPMHVLSYSSAWTGTVDERGRFWKPTSHPIGARTALEDRETGLDESAFRLYMNSFDPRSERADSVSLGRVVYRSYGERVGSGGWRRWGIPFDARPISAPAQDGTTWHTADGGFPLLRLSDTGDTLLVLDVAIDPVPVTTDDRQAFVEEQAVRGPAVRRSAETVADLMPDAKPAIASLTPSDRGQIWIERTVSAGEPAVFDVFSGDGAFVGSVALSFSTAPYLPIRIRHGHLYAVVANDLDVQTVVRAPLPPAFH